MSVVLVWVAVMAGACARTADKANAPVRDRVVELGRSLFFDASLSADGQVSCASCHRPALAYSDGLAHASGAFGRVGTRNTPGLLDVQQQRGLFWDGRRATLEDQALDPMLNEVEHGLATEPALLADRRWSRRSPATRSRGADAIVAALHAGVEHHGQVRLDQVSLDEPA